MIVVDTSALIAALAGMPDVSNLRSRLGSDGDLHAPHLVDVEFQHALRRLVTTRAISQERAAGVRQDFADLAIMRYPHMALADRMWELRANVTAYDAAFVVLAETLDVPLITCDGRLSRSSGHRATIELFR